MPDENQQRGENAEGRQYSVFGGKGPRHPQAKHAEYPGRGHRGQRDIAGGGDQGQPAEQCAERGDRQQHAQDAGPGRHPLAALEPQVDREEMAQQGRHSRGDGQAGRGHGALAGLADPAGNGGRQGPFEKIEHEHQDAETPAQHSTNVRRADVAAALPQNVDAAQRRDQVAERNRPDQVGGQESGGLREHGVEATTPAASGSNGARFRPSQSPEPRL